MFDVKGEIDYSTKNKEEGSFPPLKEGIESNKVINNKELTEHNPVLKKTVSEMQPNSWETQPAK